MGPGSLHRPGIPISGFALSALRSIAFTLITPHQHGCPGLTNMKYVLDSVCMAAHTSEISTSSNCSSLAWCHQTPAELGASGPTSLLQDRTAALEQTAARALSVDVQLQVGVEECGAVTGDSDSMSRSSAAPWGGRVLETRGGETERTRP